MSIKHEEWEKENSLSCKEDRTSSQTNPWKPEQGAPPLTEEEVNNAMEGLNNNSFVKKFPRHDRTYADPPLTNQLYGLISFTPAKGATPNENGVYGFAKLRGNFATEIESNQRAEEIIRKFDSYHQIYHTYVGRPFPLTSSSKYSAEVSEVDIRKQTTESVSADIKNKKDSERKEIEEIKQREEALLSESKRAQENIPEDPYETYITLKVKKAQLSWTYLEHKKKMEEVLHILIKTKKELEDLDQVDPTYKDRYFEKYKKARIDAGLKESAEELKNNFMIYMVEDADIPELNN
jgi:hypothetical protein